MNIEAVDKWVVISIETPDGTVIKKIFVGWWGGYLGTDSWRLSSQIVSVKKSNGDSILVTTASGSTYVLHKNSIGMTAYMGEKMSQWAKQASIEIVCPNCGMNTRHKKNCFLVKWDLL